MCYGERLSEVLVGNVMEVKDVVVVVMQEIEDGQATYTKHHVENGLASDAGAASM